MRYLSPQEAQHFDLTKKKTSVETWQHWAGSGVPLGQVLGPHPETLEGYGWWLRADRVGWLAEEQSYWQAMANSRGLKTDGLKDALPIEEDGVELWPTKRVSAAICYGKKRAGQLIEEWGGEKVGDKWYLARSLLEKHKPGAAQFLEITIHPSLAPTSRSIQMAFVPASPEPRRHIPPTY